MSQDVRLIYVTCPDRDVAVHLAKTLVQERLAACANVGGDVTSFYWWADTLEHSQEVWVLLKTTQANVPRLMDRAIELHPYQVPCVVALPVVAGNPDFLHWIAAEVR